MLRAIIHACPFVSQNPVRMREQTIYRGGGGVCFMSSDQMGFKEFGTEPLIINSRVKHCSHDDFGFEVFRVRKEELIIRLSLDIGDRDHISVIYLSLKKIRIFL